jgi:hypothetical protein
MFQKTELLFRLSLSASSLLQFLLLLRELVPTRVTLYDVVGMEVLRNSTQYLALRYVALVSRVCLVHIT